MEVEQPLLHRVVQRVMSDIQQACYETTSCNNVIFEDGSNDDACIFNLNILSLTLADAIYFPPNLCDETYFIRVLNFLLRLLVLSGTNREHPSPVVLEN